MNPMSACIRQEVIFQASPQRVYEAIIDSKKFSDLTGAPAKIGLDAGATFSCFGGMITGCHIECRVRSRRG
ncbi:MAG: hypothetical protein ABI619_07985 [Betaproteobacteria bacterium]